MKYCRCLKRITFIFHIPKIHSCLSQLGIHTGTIIQVIMYTIPSFCNINSQIRISILIFLIAYFNTINLSINKFLRMKQKDVGQGASVCNCSNTNWFFAAKCSSQSIHHSQLQNNNRFHCYHHYLLKLKKKCFAAANR